MVSGLYTTRWGSAGPLIVMVHGSAQGSEVGGDRHFSRQAALADEGFRVVVPDRPGHGRTDSPGRPDDAVADGALIIGLLENGAHLVGHSFGACVALAATAMRPDLVHSLTLIEPAMMPLAIEHPVVRQFVGQLGQAAASASSPAEAATQFAKIVGIPDEIRGGSSTDELNRMGEGLRRLKLPTPVELTNWLAKVKEAAIPLLVIEGGSNPAYGAVADRVAELGHGRHLVIKSPHHFPQLVSDEFNDTLVALAKDVDAKRAA